MIADSLSNWKTYHFSKIMQEVLDFLENKAFSAADGTYELQGKDCYVKIFGYTTDPENAEKLEVHHEYVDVQVWLSGCERMAVAPAARLSLHTQFDEANDVEFRAMPQDRDAAYFDMKPGEFMVLFPQDAHSGKIALPKHGPEAIRKVVVKIKKDLVF